MQTQDILLRADEIDAGTKIQSPKGARPLSALESSDKGPVNARPTPPPRPILRREGSAQPPPPPSQPPPAPPQNDESFIDSLNIGQVRQLVRQFPKAEAVVYSYEYQDTESFSVELDEWFQYTPKDVDRDFLLHGREDFEEQWLLYWLSLGKEDALTWLEVAEEERAEFLRREVGLLKAEAIDTRQRAAATILYVLMGVFRLTAGIGTAPDHDSKIGQQGNEVQIEWLHRNVDLFLVKGLLPALYEVLVEALRQPLNGRAPSQSDPHPDDGVFDEARYNEVSAYFSCLYVIVESVRSRAADRVTTKTRKIILALQPNPLVFLTKSMAQLRWDDTYNIPLVRASQLLWKLMLLSFGDIKCDLEKMKSILQPRVDPFSAEASKPVLTASPLDYHQFRQEITSKYPAYNPPQPLIPLDLHQKNIIPSWSRMENIAEPTQALPKHDPHISIMHKPVRIDTPAPSPPPSPGGMGAKGGKKQNYQTAQNFPFIYPPPDYSMNGQNGELDPERRWENTAVPASVVEAGELFASRMRMTRAMRQLWRERDAFLKHDRGWDGWSRKPDDEEPIDHGLDDKLEDHSMRSRLEAVNQYFRDALPELQSLIIVLSKMMLNNVMDIAQRNEQGNGLARSKSNGNLNQAPNQNTLPTAPSPPRPNQLNLEALEDIRSREISHKTILALILQMLKWFKISHILKFEYLTQLLLDAQYVQICLKYFAHQNLEQLVSFKYDLDKHSVWQYCYAHSDHPPLLPVDAVEEDEDDAVPPPIARHRPIPSEESKNDDQTQPQIDDQGNPIPESPVPKAYFSARQFQTSINSLRILQKITRAKPHRILMLVSFKSSQILRRILNVPEPHLRLYTLKLFKLQVPYCGRKWRQMNMRVITLIYLYCRPELRDDWLAGMHEQGVNVGMGGQIGAGVEHGDSGDEALPTENALRALTAWWLSKTYPKAMKAKRQEEKQHMKDESAGSEGGEDEDDSLDHKELDFFERQLARSSEILARLNFQNDDEDIAFGEEAASSINAVYNSDQTQQSEQTRIDNDRQSEMWAAESPNSEFSPAGIAAGGGNVQNNYGHWQ